MFNKGGLYDNDKATEQLAAAAAAAAAAGAAGEPGASDGEEGLSSSGRDPEDLTFDALQGPGNRKVRCQECRPCGISAATCLN